MFLLASSVFASSTQSQPAWDSGSFGNIMIQCSGTAAWIQTGIPSSWWSLQYCGVNKTPFHPKCYWISPSSFILPQEKRKQKIKLLFPKIPASFGWQWTDPWTWSYTVLKTVYCGYAVCVRKPPGTLFKGLKWMRTKYFKNYCKGTMYFTDYQYSLALNKIYIEKSLFWCIDWQIMKISNFKDLISHCNFFPRKKCVYMYKS